MPGVKLPLSCTAHEHVLDIKLVENQVIIISTWLSLINCVELITG